MSSLERGLCLPEEYLEYEAVRIPESSLAVDGLYTFMTRLDTDNERSAGKIPARVTSLRAQNGNHRVDLTLLNSDLNPDVYIRSTFGDGYWLKEGSESFTLAKQKVLAGYLKDYSDEFDDELSLWVARGVEAPEFIPV
jgi:hypothetical protein